MTLADRLAAQGRLGLDLLERFGDDLLEVVAYLESRASPTATSSPTTSACGRAAATARCTSSCSTSRSPRRPTPAWEPGTPGYLDPFLAERPASRWDPAADRYAAAATLHEMATGTRPVWGDGRTDPIHLADDQPRLDR